MEDRILVWAPPRDGRLTCDFLDESGFTCRECATLEVLTSEWQKGAAALVIAGELLSASALANLQAMLAAQAAWSDPPIIVVGGDNATDQLDAITALGNVSLLHRPVSLRTLRSTVRSALRARRRQYQVRDLLELKDDAERRKDEFLAMLAHELRNPLAPLRTGLQLLRLQPPEETVGRTLGMMERQLTNLTRLVDDLLDVSRIMRRKIALKKAHTDLRTCARESVDAAQCVVSETGLTIDLDVPAAPVIVDADSVRLEQMIGNVLNNAVKFTPNGGAVRVALAVEDGEAVLRVADTGVGIAPEHLAHVFDLFAQAPRTLDRSEGGLGIGLTVVKLLAELHGGQAHIFSDGPGAGTEVVVRLPTVAAEALRESHAIDEPGNPDQHRRILVIEDNHDVAEMLAAYLQQMGHRVLIAHDGNAGLEAALHHYPDVLICDVGLPGVDGYAIARRLRQEDAFRSCLMIAITGYGEIADRERARKAGFAHHLTKPADPTQVADLIARAVPLDEVKGGEQHSRVDRAS